MKLINWFKSLFKSFFKTEKTETEAAVIPCSVIREVDLSCNGKPAGYVLNSFLPRPFNLLRSFRYRCICGEDHFFQKAFHAKSKTIQDFKQIGDCGRDTLIPGSQFTLQSWQ